MPTEVSYISILAICNSNADSYLEKGIPIVSSEFKEFNIDRSVIKRTEDLLRSHGFELGPLVGISFSVSGDAKIFKKHFDLELIQSENKGLEMHMGGKNYGEEIKGKDLPEILQDSLYALVIPTPPIFGPVGFI